MSEAKYKPTIGLEIHAELKTKTKMFCACLNDSDEKRPNVNICPVCMGHPGTLPVINKEAVKNVLKVGLAINGKLALEFSEFDRKNYFYPDIPKGYQISQYKYPLVREGELAGVLIERIHLEEDTGKSSHVADPEQTEGKSGYSLVDFNRAGVPLMELVTKPVIKSGEEIVKFGEELQKTLQYLGVASVNMEKGEMRLEVNISVSDTDQLGTKVEVKNINSFKAAKSAALYEQKRQTELLEKGGAIKQETRGWDEKTQTTFSQRSKEDSHDYRYFPDPDLPKLVLKDLPEFSIESLKQDLKETPEQKRSRYGDKYGIKDADVAFFIENIGLAKLFEDTTTHLNDKKDFQLLSNYIVSDLASAGEKGLAVDSRNLAELIEMASKGEVSSRGAKDILAKMAKTGEGPRVIADKEGLFQKSNEAELLKVVEMLIKSNPEAVDGYKSGKTQLLQYLVGQAMKETNGSGNPQVLKVLFEKSLS